MYVFEDDNPDPHRVVRIPCNGFSEIPIPILHWNTLVVDVRREYEDSVAGALVERQKFNALVRYPGQLTPYC